MIEILTYAGRMLEEIPDQDNPQEDTTENRECIMITKARQRISDACGREMLASVYVCKEYPYVRYLGLFDCEKMALMMSEAFSDYMN